jgi:hypothetical protein
VEHPGARKADGGSAGASAPSDDGAADATDVTDVPGSGRGTWDEPSRETEPAAWESPDAAGSADSPTVMIAAPSPAAGPVPVPGPGAASPPPWRRMPSPDDEPVDATAAPHGQHVTTATDLLDDVPTAFVEPPGDIAATPGDTAPRLAPVVPAAERAGWSSIRTRNRPPRRAALQLKRLDPWSVLKLALVLAGVLFLIWMVAVGLLYGVLAGMGVWDRLNGTYSDLVSGDGASGGQSLISAWRVFGYAALFGIINGVLTAVALTVSAFIYNVCADLVGGIEVTLSERD